MNKPLLKINKPDHLIRQEMQLSKLRELRDKPKSKLTLEDLDTKLDIIIELLTNEPHK